MEEVRRPGRYVDLLYAVPGRALWHERLITAV